jgi:hypothetical protein
MVNILNHIFALLFAMIVYWVITTACLLPFVWAGLSIMTWCGFLTLYSASFKLYLMVSGILAIFPVGYTAWNTTIQYNDE